MRNFARVIPILFIGGFICFTVLSCEKKTTPDTTPVNDTVLTEQKLIGKWEITAVRIYDYKNDTLKSKYEFIKNVGGVQDGMPMGSEPWVWQLHTTYLTFQAAPDFFHADKDGNPEGYMLANFLPSQGGLWAFKNAGQIELTTKSLKDGVTLKQMTWETAYFQNWNGKHITMGTTDTFTSFDGSRGRTLLILSLERP